MLHGVFDRVRDPPHQLGQPSPLVVGERAQHVIDRVPDRPADTHPDPGECLGSERRNHRVQPVVARGAAAGANPQPAKGKVELIMDNKDALQWHVIFGAEGLRRLAREVHPGLRLGDHEFVRTAPDAAGQRFRGAVRHPAAVPAGEFVDHQKAHVVAGPLVFTARVAQADHQPAVDWRRLSRFSPKHRP